MAGSRRYGAVGQGPPSRRSGATGCGQRADRKLGVVSRPVGRLRSHLRPVGLRTSGLASGWFSANGRSSGPSGDVLRELGRCQAGDHGRPGLLSWAECYHRCLRTGALLSGRLLPGGVGARVEATSTTTRARRPRTLNSGRALMALTSPTCGRSFVPIENVIGGNQAWCCVR